jgi:hypothetical protein
MLSTKKVFPRHRNRQHAKRAKPPLGTTGVPTFFSKVSSYLKVFLSRHLKGCSNMMLQTFSSRLCFHVLIKVWVFFHLQHILRRPTAEMKFFFHEYKKLFPGVKNSSHQAMMMEIF